MQSEYNIPYPARYNICQKVFEACHNMSLHDRARYALGDQFSTAFHSYYILSPIIGSTSASNVRGSSVSLTAEQKTEIDELRSAAIRRHLKNFTAVSIQHAALLTYS